MTARPSWTLWRPPGASLEQVRQRSCPAGIGLTAGWWAGSHHHPAACRSTACPPFPLRLAALESPSVGDAAVNGAASKYIGLLLGLVSSYGAGSAAPDTAAAAAASPDEALAAAEAGAGAGASPQTAPASKLRHAAQWEWSDGALFAPPPGSQTFRASSNDAAFELASCLVSYGVRLMHAASLTAQDSATGVSTPATTAAYNLLRQAAGLLETAAREVLPCLPSGTAADLDLQVGSRL